jgi:hypothetical protein
LRDGVAFAAELLLLLLLPLALRAGELLGPCQHIQIH